MIENVSFDTAQMTANNNLIGTDYQQGPLYDTNLREFIFSKTNGKCSYCGAEAEEIDHIVPRSKGGTNSTFNLTSACKSCNKLKSKLSLKEFGKIMNKDYSHLEPKKLPKDASIVQSARNYMFQEVTKIVPNTIGRVAIRHKGSFNIRTKSGLVKDIGYKYCHIIQRGDGYLYSYKERIL